MWHPPITAGMQWIRKVLANAHNVSLLQFVIEFSIPVASPDIGTAIPWADDDNGSCARLHRCCLVNNMLKPAVHVPQVQKIEEMERNERYGHVISCHMLAQGPEKLRSSRILPPYRETESVHHRTYGASCSYVLVHFAVHCPKHTS